MFKLFSALFGFLERLGAYFTNKQLIDAGKAEQANEAVKEVQKRVEKAEAAVSTPDPVRDERLHSKYDRASRRRK
jgi:predicted RecB family endonuclease